MAVPNLSLPRIAELMRQAADGEADLVRQAAGEVFCACGHIAKFHGSYHKTRCLVQNCGCPAFADAGPLCKCGEPKAAHTLGTLDACKKSGCQCIMFRSTEEGASTLTKVHRARLVDDV